MIDPFDRFSNAVDRSEVAGYFEFYDPARPEQRRALWFRDPVRTIRIGHRTDPEDLRRETSEILRKGSSRALVGYLGFDAVGLFEPLLRSFPRDSPFPMGELAVIESARFESVPPPPRLPRVHNPPLTALSPNEDSLPRAAYCRSVRRLIRAIRDGEAFQVVLAHRRTWPRPADLIARLRVLRSVERYAFFYHLKFGSTQIVGASPESVLDVRRDRAFVNPIAGTRPLGTLGRGRRGLSRDPKELAEHRMLVDLARNDLGKVSKPGTVRLLWQERRETFSRLEHLVSSVSGQLKPGVGPIDALGAVFPAGTVSGAPKIRATHLLRAEERTWRGPYAGTVGLIRPGGEAHWGLTIRSAFLDARNMFTAAGAGIVHASEPQREFDETLTKLSQLEATLLGSDRR